MRRILIAAALALLISSPVLAEPDVRSQVLTQMDHLYNQMRAIDLTWMDYLSDDATAVHNGEILPHDRFVEAELAFFNALERLEITMLAEPVVHILGPDAASVTVRHSINTWMKDGEAHQDIKQSLTFVWHRREGRWYTVHAHFVTAGATNH